MPRLARRLSVRLASSCREPGTSSKSPFQKIPAGATVDPGADQPACKRGEKSARILDRLEPRALDGAGDGQRWTRKNDPLPQGCQAGHRPLPEVGRRAPAKPPQRRRRCLHLPTTSELPHSRIRQGAFGTAHLRDRQPLGMLRRPQ